MIRQGAREGAHALFGDQRGDRVAILRVERLDRVSDRVDPRGDGDRDRQAERQIDVVDHRLRQDARVALRRLLPIRGLAENIGHLRAGVGGGNDDLRQIGAQGERLAESGGRAAADRDRAIRLGRLERGEGALGDSDRGMHRRAGKQPGGERPELRDDVGAGRFLLRGREDEGAAAAERLHLVGQRRERAGAEHDPRGMRGIDEAILQSRLLPCRRPRRAKRFVAAQLGRAGRRV